MSLSHSDISADTSDDYTAAIELSNACREFYRNRVKATESFKQTMNSRNNTATLTNVKRTTIDDAMDRLRNEMVRNFFPLFFLVKLWVRYTLCA